MIKKALLLAAALFMAGCTLDDADNTTFTYELVPVVETDVPDTLVYREHYIFDITYQRPSPCHFFKGYNYEIDGHKRFIGVVNAVYEGRDCQATDTLTAVTELVFVPKRDDFYIFKFWQGVDENGEPIFLTKEVPVVTQ